MTEELSEASVARLAAELRASRQKIVFHPTRASWTLQQLRTLPIHPPILKGEMPPQPAPLASFTDESGKWYVRHDSAGKLWRDGPF